jgi:hypothetical protein
MMHPLIEDMSLLKDVEIESRIQDLSKKYFQTYNPALQNELIIYLDMYRAEIADRRAKQWQDLQKSRDNSLDSLINVS